MRLALVAVVLAACGGGHGATGDAATGDGISGDGAAPTVTITITNQGKPARGLTVYFQNADSSLVAVGTTDTNGVTGAKLASGGFVTTLLPQRGASDQLATITDVQVGDSLHIDLAPQVTGPISFDVVVPADPGATDYQLLTSCGMTGITQASVPTSVILTGCGTAADVIVQSVDASGPIHAFFSPDVAISASETVTLTGNYAPLVTTTLDYTGIPSGTALVASELDLATSHGVLDAAFASTTPTSTTARNSFDVPQASATAIELTTITPQAGNSYQTIVDWAPYSASYTLDYQAARLRDYATAPVYTAATQSVDWTESATGATPDFTIAELHAFRTTGAMRDWYWTIAAARGTTTIAYPKLPTDVYDFNPSAADNVTVTHLVGIKADGGYDAVRTHVLDTSIRSLVTGANGRVVSTDVFVTQL